MDELKFVYYMAIGCSKGAAFGPKRFWFDDLSNPWRKPVDWELVDTVIPRLHETKVNMALIQVDDGVLYESHPEINAPGAVTKAFLKSKLDRMRALGITPVPMLTFAAPHHLWLKEYRFMVSSAPYRKACVDLIDEICELFDNPPYFHLGMDEESSFDTMQWRDCVVMRGEKMFWEDHNLFFEACRKNGSRPWVWGDYYWIHPDYFERNMPRDVLISNWVYWHFKDYDNWLGTAIKAYEDFEKLGFDQIPTCSTGTKGNAWETMIHSQKVISPEHLKGYCCAPWCGLTHESDLLVEEGIRRFAAARAQAYPER